ncbi:MAG: N-acetyltransferase, partial [Chitinophagaceae bacterium]
RVRAGGRRHPVGHGARARGVLRRDPFRRARAAHGSERGRGLGTAMVAGALPYFFGKLQLEKLYSQPYALNAAPNRTLEKVGFVFDKEYVTIPGSLNFEQPVKRWLLTRAAFEAHYGALSDRL